MKKGFTLIELLGVIILLAVIALIAYPLIDNVIRDSRERAYQQTINGIIDAARQYGTSNTLGYESTPQVLEIRTLVNNGYLKSEEIINPINNEVLKGCVIYSWSNSKYNYEYKEDCGNLYASDSCFDYQDVYAFEGFSSISECVNSYNYYNDMELSTTQLNKICSGIIITDYKCGGTFDDVSTLNQDLTDEQRIQIVNSFTYSNGSNMNPIMPSQINNKEIVSIDSLAFSGAVPGGTSYVAGANNVITSITLPETLMVIYPGAFGINKLNSLEISNNSNLVYIENSAFYSNPFTKLTLTNLPNLLYVDAGAFYSTKTFTAEISGVNNNAYFRCDAFYNLNDSGNSIQSGISTVC